MKTRNSRSHSNSRETVVVTGASAGLGRAIANEFGKHKARVVLLARGQRGLEAAAAEIQSLGGEALAIPTDVADPEAVEAAAEKAQSHFGPIDIWVNNAMVTVFSPVKEMKPEEYKRATEVTYLGVVYGTLAALRRMLPRDRGTIVQVGSALAYRSIPLQSAYCAAKHAILGFTASLRCELIHDKSNVRVNMVHMPAMNTPQFDWVKNRLRHKPQPVPPIYEPEVGAEAVYWSAHHDRREVYVGVPTVAAIVGNKAAPDVLDHYLGWTGYKSQQTREMDDPSRPDNLWQPVDAAEDFGAHGRFENRSHRRSYQLWADLHRGSLAVGLGVAAGVVGSVIYAARNGNGGRR